MILILWLLGFHALRLELGVNTSLEFCDYCFEGSFGYALCEFGVNCFLFLIVNCQMVLAREYWVQLPIY